MYAVRGAGCADSGGHTGWQPPTDPTLDLQHVLSVHDCWLEDATAVCGDAVRKDANSVVLEDVSQLWAATICKWCRKYLALDTVFHIA